MTASLVVRTPIKTTTASVAHGSPIQDYLLAYDEEMRKQAAIRCERMSGSMFGGLATEIYLNDLQTPVGIGDMNRILEESEILHVIHRPQGFDPVTVAIAFVVAAVAVTVLAVPSLPQVNGQDVGSSSDSPNNRLSGQTNLARPYEAIPEIFGKIVSYPDLIQPSLFEYVGNIKVVREVFCIGRGTYSVGDIRDDQTLISQVPGSSATVHPPGSTPADLRIGRESNDIDGQEMVSPNDPRRNYTGRIIFKNRNSSQGATAAFSADDDVITLTGGLGLPFDLDLGVGDTFGVSGSTSNNGNYTITGLSEESGNLEINVSDDITTDESGASITITPASTPLDYIYVDNTEIVGNMSLDTDGQFVISNSSSNDGTFNIDANTTESIRPVIGDPDIEVTRFSVSESFTDEDDSSATISRVTETGDPWIGWFQLSGQMGEVWSHFQMPQGLQDQGGNRVSVQLEVQFRQTDQQGNVIGPVISQMATFEAASLAPLFMTLKQTVSTGFYQVRARRVTGKYSGSASDLLRWEDSYSITSYNSDFGDVTLLDVTTRATSFALNASRRRINADVTRMLGTARSGIFEPALVATQSFADAVVYTLLEAGRPLSEVDVEELYSIENGINSELIEFNFSFDNKDIPLGERINTICNSARVSAYRDGQVWRFIRDQARPNRTLSFNRRNIASGENQQQRYMLRKPNDFNSIILRYIDPDSNRRAEILVDIDEQNQSFIEGQMGSRPRTMDLAGCRNVTQARDRAHLEARRMVYQRRNVQDSVLNDGQLTDIGDRVAWVDIFDGDVFDGEIISNSGNQFSTSERFTPAPGSNYMVVITDSSGNTSDPAAVSAREDGNEFGFSADVSTGLVLSNGDSIQAGSRYIIGNVNDISDTDMIIVAKRPETGGRVTIEMVNYDERIYEMDGQL